MEKATEPICPECKRIQKGAIPALSIEYCHRGEFKDDNGETQKLNCYGEDAKMTFYSTLDHRVNMLGWGESTGFYKDKNGLNFSFKGMRLDLDQGTTWKLKSAFEKYLGRGGE